MYFLAQTKRPFDASMLICVCVTLKQTYYTKGIKNTRYLVRFYLIPNLTLVGNTLRPYTSEFRENWGLNTFLDIVF